MAKKKSKKKTTKKAEKKVEPPVETPVEPVANNLNPETVARAKKLGMSDEMIATYTDETVLFMACQNIKPQATATLEKPKQKKPHFRVVGKPLQETFNSEITERRAMHVSRVSYDEGAVE